MEIAFIGQALDDNKDSSIGYKIIESLNDDRFKKFTAIVAFVSVSGLNNLADSILVKRKE